MYQWGASRNPWAGYRIGPTPAAYGRPNPQTVGRKVLLSNIGQPVEGC